MTLRTISYGGGVQSTALVVLAAQGVIDYPVALFSNVGDDSEHPATIDYVRNVAIPWAAEHGVTIHELHRTMRTGERRTLLQDLERDSRTINIPVRMANGAPGNRNCTSTFKHGVVRRWLKEHGATADTPVTVAIGISTDEMERASNRRPDPEQVIEYPLLELGHNRAACARIIADAGLPVPPKSACWFCPFKKPATWAEMRRDEPELFQRAADLEALLNRRRDKLGKDHVYLTRFARPIGEAITEAQAPLFDMDGPEGCDEGHCWT